ncbi:hypothetical protein EJB05_16303, partial [Eragrostis curvula]
MAGGGSSPTHPPPAKRLRPPLGASGWLPRADIHGREFPAHRHPGARRAGLPYDLLLAIFLHLPSLATLVRAALTCRLWRRAVASTPAFRRRFRALKPPPLLGLFFQNDSADQGLNIHGQPAFVPARRRRDRDLTAAVRGGDFFLTSLHDLFEESLSWYIVDCCHGCVLLMYGDLASFVVFNPLTRRCEDAFDIWPEDAFNDYRGYCRQLDARLVVSREDPTSSRVVILSHDKSRVPTVYSSDTWEWSVLPWVDVPATSSDYDNRWIQTDGGKQANGFLYWAYQDRRSCMFDVGETKDGVTCIVYPDKFNIGVIVLRRGDDGVERWVLDRVVPLHTQLEVLEGDFTDSSDLCVLAVRDGYAYLAVFYHDTKVSSWYLSLCLETMKLERLFRKTFCSDVHPCIMSWPSSLVGNYGRFALENAP